jgi:broad specificity phosphatase PhoE
MYSPPSSDTCVMYLLRHGATENNLMKPPKLQGRGIDLPLSAEGRRQAECAQRALSKQKIAAVYSSTLLRAKETAQIVARPHRHEVVTNELIIEVDVGRWEMRSWVDIAVEEPEAYRLFQDDPGTHGYAGGENLRQVMERATPALVEIMGEHLGHEIVVVGHNVLNRAFLAGVLELPLAKARNIHQENCGLNIVELREGKLKLVTLNAVGHLHGLD